MVIVRKHLKKPSICPTSVRPHPVARRMSPCLGLSDTGAKEIGFAVGLKDIGFFSQRKPTSQSMFVVL